MRSNDFVSKVLAPLLALTLAACGGSVDMQAPEEGTGTQPAALGETKIRLMAANTTSGNYQSYDPGEGTRIFQGTKPDVVMIQEFNYGDNSASAIRGFVDTAFGSTFYYYREAGAQIPNGVISRWPILASGEWDDPYVSNRDFAWARIDIPGTKDLWVVSVHLLTSSSTDRNNEATSLRNFINANVPASDYLVIGGDFNTSSRTEAAFTTLGSLVVTSSPYPADKNGNGNTNAGRTKPYDHVLVDSDLKAYQTATVIGASTFSGGLVVDTRVYSPLSEISPALSGDSGATNMQHMAVIKDFLVPGDGTTTASVTVTAPNGGESWAGGTAKSITWTSSGVTNVKLEYTLDGTTWNVITSSTAASTGSYTWTVPSQATTAARVRVTDTASATVTDTRNAAFTITTGTATPVITAESEPNDTVGTADARVGRGTNVSGAISTSTDVDWFAFTVDATGSVTVSLTMAAGADLDWYLYHSSNTSTYLTRGYTASNPETASYTVSQTGTYYVKVVGYSGATDSYTLNVSGAGVTP